MAVATVKKERYRVVTGVHYDLNPNFNPEKLGLSKEQAAMHPDRLKRYEQGDVIETDQPYDKKYANKFEKVRPGDVATVVTDERRAEVADLLEADKNWQESDRKFLEELSDENFGRIRRHTEQRQQVENVGPLGRDVTSQFQRAYDEGFKVFVNSQGKHQLTRGPNAKPLNKEPLEGKEVDKWVNQYLKENK
jgi:hypothetical protein